MDPYLKFSWLIFTHFVKELFCWENLFKDQNISFRLSFRLSLDYVLMLLGETWSWSLLLLKGFIAISFTMMYSHVGGKWVLTVFLCFQFSCNASCFYQRSWAHISNGLVNVQIPPSLMTALMHFLINNWIVSFYHFFR